MRESVIEIQLSRKITFSDQHQLKQSHSRPTEARRKLPLLLEAKTAEIPSSLANDHEVRPCTPCFEEALLPLSTGHYVRDDESYRAGKCTLSARRAENQTASYSKS